MCRRSVTFTLHLSYKPDVTNSYFGVFSLSTQGPFLINVAVPFQKFELRRLMRGCGRVSGEWKAAFLGFWWAVEYRIESEMREFNGMGIGQA